MKTGTPQHPKMIDLSMRLGIPIYAAVGIMEMLWHFADKHAIRGDIGRYPDAVIAQALSWDGDVPSLIDALVWSKWIDRCETNRLLIHDWPDHCQDYCKKRVRDGKISFATLKPIETTVRDILENSRMFKNFSDGFAKVPESVPTDSFVDTQNGPRTSPVSHSVSTDRDILENSGKFWKKGVGVGVGSIEPVVKDRGNSFSPPLIKTEFETADLFESLYKSHPQGARKDRGIAERYFVQSIGTGTDAAEITRVHALMCATEDWQWKNGAKAPTLAQWLLDKGWKYPPSMNGNGDHPAPKGCPVCMVIPCECFEKQLRREEQNAKGN